MVWIKKNYKHFKTIKCFLSLCMHKLYFKIFLILIFQKIDFCLIYEFILICDKKIFYFFYYFLLLKVFSKIIYPNIPKNIYIQTLSYIILFCLSKWTKFILFFLHFKSFFVKLSRFKYNFGLSILSIHKFRVLILKQRNLVFIFKTQLHLFVLCR